ncbi:DoxX family protein [Nocardia sp. alder85J]|uniref:DoxX family protein n=1 Tax=Nocardia sp. alder85J TaxID=2862949 RepID=UPI001CD57486|nr:DoxX family protein [Nocardia sp. alder85J]MCX4095662.1 DoxX family protein [Nocardia sp. alder85J]
MTVADTASLLLRLTVGLTLAAHGWNHLFGSGGLSGTARWFASIGLRPPRLHALVSGAGELCCGLALAAGLFTALAAAFVVGTMAVAAVTAHRANGFFVFKDGYEYVLVLAVVAAVISLIGPGRASLDALIGISSSMSGVAGLLTAVLAGGLGGAVLLATSWRPNQEPK